MTERKISVIGLGYVGLPVAVTFGKKGLTIGFDNNLIRLEELKNGQDKTCEVTQEELESSKILFTNQVEELKKADFHIVAVPTPVDDAKQPDLTPMLKASETLGKVLKKGDIVVYESTVFPGATEELCVPVLERVSGLKCGVDFKVGYSPERINPGDREHSFTKILKVVSGQDQETLEIVARTYESVVTAGVYRASSIKVAEAAKVIENTQRDLNIALINELALIFDKMQIDTQEVLAAAGTKWNFLPFKPGLVGGHCIGVDPYHLTYKAEKIGYDPQVILAGRRINDSMGKFIAQRTIKELFNNGNPIQNPLITILGLTFKEDCPDLRNSKVIDIVKELQDFGVTLQLHDPIAPLDQAKTIYGIPITALERLKPASAVIIAVAHKDYMEFSSEQLNSILLDKGVLMDIKGIFKPGVDIIKKYRYWRL
jgi:UDP-N-acetyl-D-glucosamine/UDP-N-acetyl-D-galactosamine dehydrogenase